MKTRPTREDLARIIEQVSKLAEKISITISIAGRGLTTGGQLSALLLIKNVMIEMGDITEEDAATADKMMRIQAQALAAHTRANSKSGKEPSQ